ncbi:MAG TPA: phenylalanine--tRNA ligase subunit beta [Acidimicrobiales bacterium]|nr:phenylalanine--tRNA ligase subunit beta [Acidimicrobiales bacterium]
MRVPLSWLRDFAPFDGEPADLAATLDDLGLVVEGIEHIGEGLDDIVVARVEEISAIEGADRIRRVVVDAGAGPVEVVCGAWNFEVGNLVPLAPVGAVLPGGFTIGRRKMKGVVSNGMLCSGRELGLSEDHEGIMVLDSVEGAAAGRSFVEALAIEKDVVFDVAVEANRPDAWSMAGVARDLAARLELPFTIPEPTPPSAEGLPVDTLTSVRLDDSELCPRFTARVITGVTVAASPAWLARRLTLAGMRPINNVVDASNYVMLELGQPTHPYDLDRLPGEGIVVRRARPGESVTTLDGVARELGTPGPGLGDDGQDCLICDADANPVGIGGVMGGESSEISESTTRVLLEAAYFVPIAIARTSKRLNLRTEASARFERGTDPWGIDRAADRFSELLSTTSGPGTTVASGVIDVRGDVPEPLHLAVRVDRINALLGTAFDSSQVAERLAPLGIGSEAGPEPESLRVTVPTFRPDIRPEPFGQADIAEEVARTYGYSRLPRRQPAWPQPGGLTRRQRERRLVKDVMCGLGAHEAWTASIVTEKDIDFGGSDRPRITITNPLVSDERFLRASMLPGLLRALAYNAERRQGALRLFEVGTVFEPAESEPEQGTEPGRYPVDPGEGPPAIETERLSVVFASEGDDARTAVAAWYALVDALRIDNVELRPSSEPRASAVHPTRHAVIENLTKSVVAHDRGSPRPASDPKSTIGEVGEADPLIVSQYGLVGPDGRPLRVGWLDVDLGPLLDPSTVLRLSDEARPISRFPSADIDLAFVVPESVPAGTVLAALTRAGGELLESVKLFDVYRGDSVPEGTRSLAYHLRFCALDRTLTDDEVGVERARCIEAVESGFGASLR